MRAFGGADGVRADLGGYDCGDRARAGRRRQRGRRGRRARPDAARDTRSCAATRRTARSTATFPATDRAFGLDDAPVAVIVRGRRQGRRRGELEGRQRQRRRPAPLSNGDGTRDDTFGIGGVSLHDAGAYPVGDALVRPNGRVLVVGSLRVGGRPQLALLRYQGDTSTAPRPAQGFVRRRCRRAARLLRRLRGQAPAAAPAPRSGRAGTWRGASPCMPGGRGLVLEGYGGAPPVPLRRRLGRGPGRLGQPDVGEQGQRPGRRGRPRGHRRLRRRPVGRSPRVQDRRRTEAPGPDRRSRRGRARTSPAASRCCPTVSGGYVLDATGGLHPFGGAPKPAAGVPSWPGQDRAGGVTIAPDGSGGWVVDSFGRLLSRSASARTRSRPRRDRQPGVAGADRARRRRRAALNGAAAASRR